MPENVNFGIKASTVKQFELSLWVSRSGVEDLKEIEGVLASHPGKTPVLLHLQSGTGKRATIECGDQFRVERSEALSSALGRWMD